MAESKRVQRLLRVFIALDEHPIIGLSNKDLSVGRNYAYGIKTLQIAERFRQQHERLQSKIAEIGKRVDVD
ncbi:TPA: DNA-binding protein [Neisseria meningitidis]